MSDAYTKAQRAAQERLNGRKRKDNPPPDDYPGDPEPWHALIPLGDVPAVEAFPVEVLPVHLVDYVHTVAGALACPPDYIAVPLLALAGAAIGASRALEVKRGWTERPNLYVSVVGLPGSLKTPAQKAVAGPVYAEQSRRMANYQRVKLSWEERDEDERGEKPKPSTLYVSDITTEKLAEVLQDNPRGVAYIRDELTAWVSAMDQYRAKGRGSDRQFYLSAWAGEPVSVHRKNQDEPVFIAHPFVAVVGGLPPDLLHNLRGDRAVSDGFFDRILPTYPEPTPATGETWNCVPDAVAVAWAEALEYLWSLKPENDGDGDRPHFVRLDGTGRKAWQAFTNDLAAEMNSDTLPDCLRGPWSKHRGYCARLSLILHCLRLAVGEADAEDVDGESVSRAARLIQYFQSHARKVYAALDADERIAAARKVLRWLKRERRETFTRRDAHHALEGTFHTAEELDRPLEVLTQRNYLRPLPSVSRPGPGRKPSQVYEVNPATLTTQSTQSTK